MKKVIFILLCITLCVICIGCKNINNEEMVKDDNKNLSDYYKIDGDYVSFGYYPQSVATQEEVENLSSNIDKNGFYTSKVDGSKYIKYKTKSFPYLETLKFSNGEQIKRDTEYYFKCEPIIWKIINKKNDYVTIATVNLLDCHFFMEEENVIRKDAVVNNEETSVWFNIKDNVPEGTYANAWEYSDLREWLNSDFKNCFSKEEQSIIQLSELDNSFSILEYSSLYPWIKQNNTFDYFYIFSFEDVLNSNFGYNKNSNIEDENRKLKATDYAIVKGALLGFEKKDFEKGNAFWLLRSPGIYSSFVSGVNIDGSVNETHSSITDDSRGICIVTQIKLI